MLARLFIFLVVFYVNHTFHYFFLSFFVNPIFSYSSYVVVKGVGGAARQEAPKSLSNLEFAIDRKSIDPSLAYLAKR